MRWALSDASGYCVHARDGSLGTVTDIYFDDVNWMVRYLAVSGGNEIAGQRNFLLAPEVINSIDREVGWIFVFLRTATVHNSPEISTEKNITQQKEHKLRTYYGWPNYWPNLSSTEPSTPPQMAGKPRLHSLTGALGYRVLADGEEIGGLTDIIVDDHTWKINGLEVDTTRWLPVGRVWLRSDCIRHWDDKQHQVALTLPRSAINESVIYNPQIIAPPNEGSALMDVTHAAVQFQEQAAVT